MPKKNVYWISPVPETCQVGDCGGNELTDVFVDGRTAWGPWACMCEDCHFRHGGQLGTGVGQKYRKQPDGRWLKVGG